MIFFFVVAVNVLLYEINLFLVHDLFAHFKHDLDEVFNHLIASMFGFNVNKFDVVLHFIPICKLVNLD